MEGYRPGMGHTQAMCGGAWPNIASIICRAAGWPDASAGRDAQSCAPGARPSLRPPQPANTSSGAERNAVVEVELLPARRARRPFSVTQVPS